MAESPSENKFELEVFGVLALLRKRWKVILAGALIASAFGVFVAITASPVYTSEATISPRDNQSGGGGAASFLSQMGGGLFGGQLGLTSGLDKMEILVGSPEIARRVIEDHDLLPRLYPKSWDARSKRWKKSPPNLRLAVESLRSGNLKVVQNTKKKFIELAFFAPDSILARDLAIYYLQVLNSSIQEDTRNEADGNRAYLETQMASTQDPLLREQIQNMIVGEIGKSMLVSTKAFDVLVQPEIPLKRLKPQRKKIVLGAFVIGAVLSSLGVAVWQVMQDRKKRAAGTA